MIYLTITLLLSSICGLAIILLRKAPARLRFYICLMVFVSWLTPWQLLQFEETSHAFTLPLNILSEFNLVNSTAANTNAKSVTPVLERSSGVSPTFYWLWLAPFAIGFVLFLKDVIAYIKLHRRWLHHSTLDNQAWKTAKVTQPHCDIRRIDTQAPGMTTGLNKPIIWLDSEQHEAENIRTIVLHELTHIRQHDPYWLWVINFVQRLFWWNPLIWFTANYARQQIELSCDEQCKKHLPEGSYQLQLIKLTLQVNKAQHSLHMPAVLQMSGTPAFNLQRINKLNKEHKMKKRYVLVIASLLSLTGWIGFSNATVNMQQSVNQEDKKTNIIDVLNAMNEQDFSTAKTRLDNLASKIDSFDASDQAKIWKLYAGVAYEIDSKNPQIIAYIDKAIALEEILTATDLLPILNMAQSLAASQERWDKQLDYSQKWLDVADDSVDKKHTLHMTAISYYSLEQYSTAIDLLNELVSISETQGSKPKENWLNLLVASYVGTENITGALTAQEKITALYPSEKNQDLLTKLTYKL